LQNSENLDEKKTVAWISSGRFNSARDSNANSAAYSASGNLTSAGLKTTRDDFQILGGVFTSNSDASRKTYVGKDQIDTNGLVLGLGKNQQTSVGKIYTFAQIGAGFYDFNSSRSVLVNGFGQASQGLGTGDFQYLNFGAAYKIPTNLTGEFALNSSLGAQKTNRGNWSETGLSAGNLAVSKSSSSLLNFDLGASYKNDLKFLPKGAFYKAEITAQKSNIYSGKNATVTDGSFNYNLSPKYSQNVMLGLSGYFSVPLNLSTSLVAKVDRRQNGDFKETSGNLGFRYSF
jgi:hypothetical protein